MTSIILRDYQKDSLTGVRNEFELGKKRVLLVGPTGCGKTVMFSYMVATQLSKNENARALILTDRLELHDQAGGTLAKFGLHFEDIISGKKKFNTRARCYVGMIETYFKRLQKAIKQHPERVKDSFLLSFKLVIFDEAHKSTFYKVLRLWDSLGFNPYVVGCTATPQSAKKDEPLSNYYQALVNRVQIPELVERGFLSPCITYAPEIDKSKLKLDNKGEYTDQSQLETFAKRSVYDGLLKRYREVCAKYNGGEPMKTICFNINVQHSVEVTEMFNQAGLRAMHVDGETKKSKSDNQRKKIIDAYINGEFPILCNVGILNAGFDDPDTRCIIFNRATTSIPLWLQSQGRGSRIAPGKPNFIVLDMGENWIPLDPWDADRAWEEIWNITKKKSDKVGLAPKKTCDECEALMPASARTCPYCGYEHPVKERVYAEASEFTEVSKAMLPQPKYSPKEVSEILSHNRREKIPDLSVEMLLKIQEVKGYNQAWVKHRIKERATSEADFYDQMHEFAALKGYHPNWVQRQEWRPAVYEKA